jgi:hypothetical protein
LSSASDPDGDPAELLALGALRVFAGPFLHLPTLAADLRELVAR